MPFFRTLLSRKNRPRRCSFFEMIGGLSSPANCGDYVTRASDRQAVTDRLIATKTAKISNMCYSPRMTSFMGVTGMYLVQQQRGYISRDPGDYFRTRFQ